MNWLAEYSVGIHEIDEQHKKLVEHISDIEQAVRQKEASPTVHSALARLANFAQIHFCVEESLMRIHEYPHIDEHVDDHRRFSDDLSALSRRALTSGVTDEMIDFLRTWAGVHVPKHDKAYAFHFLRRTAMNASRFGDPA